MMTVDKGELDSIESQPIKRKREMRTLINSLPRFREAFVTEGTSLIPRSTIQSNPRYKQCLHGLILQFL